MRRVGQDKACVVVRASFGHGDDFDGNDSMAVIVTSCENICAQTLPVD